MAPQHVTMPDALIHLRVPASLKARWVRLSRAKGQRLTDWLIERVERPMPMTTVCIPPDLRFADLRLAFEQDGDLSFDADVIRRICGASGIDHERFAADEDALCALVAAWYRAHRARGGDPDPVAESISAEVMAEERAGQRISHHPGSA